MSSSSIVEPEPFNQQVVSLGASDEMGGLAMPDPNDPEPDPNEYTFEPMEYEEEQTLPNNVRNIEFPSTETVY